ncbi:MAG: agmatinase, partial [Promethearchaeota archaeon]
WGITLSKLGAIQGVNAVLNTFLGARTDITEAEYVIAGVPFDATSTFRRGAKDGPAAIRAASQHIESFCLLGGAKVDAGKMAIADIGDIAVSPTSAKSMLQSVEQVVNTLHDHQRKIILLGGEHSITFGSVRALPRDVILVHFDAHMDLRETYGGTPFSHACVMRRIAEQIGPNNLFQVGIRAVSQEEYEYAQAQKIAYYTTQDIEQDGAQKIADRLLSSIPFGPPLYISIDLDVLDPAFAPAVGNPEPGGLTTLQLLTILRVLAPRADFLDITEIAPKYDQGITALCAARLVLTYLCAQAGTQT